MRVSCGFSDRAEGEQKRSIDVSVRVRAGLRHSGGKRKQKQRVRNEVSFDVGNNVEITESM